MADDNKTLTPYDKPVLKKYRNIREITNECPEWQCSVIVPPPPAP